MLGYGDVPPSQGMLLHQCVLSGYSFSTTSVPVFAQGMKFLTKVLEIINNKYKKILMRRGKYMRARTINSFSLVSGYIFERDSVFAQVQAQNLVGASLRTVF